LGFETEFPNNAQYKKLLILNLPAAPSLPHISRAKADLTAGPLCSKRAKRSVPGCWRES